MNSGSGEWWVYTEDAKSYYYNLADNNNSYQVFTKDDAEQCSNFRPKDILTWCRGE